MDNRERILTAAARVYAQHGFRGATTRLIAHEAGVNEVTLFRLFGSKAQLFDELRHCHFWSAGVAELPDEPVDPERELADWCRAMLTGMRERRSLLRKAISEVEENPEAAVSACGGAHPTAEALREYVARLRQRGFAVATGDDATAISMLMSALFGDAICREIVPHAFPEPEAEAPNRYVAAFLRSLGVARKLPEPARETVPRRSA